MPPPRRNFLDLTPPGTYIPTITLLSPDVYTPYFTATYTFFYMHTLTHFFICMHTSTHPSIHTYILTHIHNIHPSTPTSPARHSWPISLLPSRHPPHRSLRPLWHSYLRGIGRGPSPCLFATLQITFVASTRPYPHLVNPPPPAPPLPLGGCVRVVATLRTILFIVSITSGTYSGCF